MYSAESILIVEDDSALRRVLKGNLQFSGFDVETARDGEEALKKIVEFEPSLVILDIMLPKIDGHEVCRTIRLDRPELPIVMLTAKGDESDIVHGLNAGADDYVTKPFSVNELLARINAVLRRRVQDETKILRFGECELDLEAHKLCRNGSPVALTPKEFGLLRLFARHPGRAMTRHQILDLVWGRDIAVTTRSIDNCVNTLRKKVEADPKFPKFIKTVRNIGYRFEATGIEDSP